MSEKVKKWCQGVLSETPPLVGVDARTAKMCAKEVLTLLNGDEPNGVALEARCAGLGEALMIMNIAQDDATRARSKTDGYAKLIDGIRKVSEALGRARDQRAGAIPGVNPTPGGAAADDEPEKFAQWQDAVHARARSEGTRIVAPLDRDDAREDWFMLAAQRAADEALEAWAKSAGYKR